MLRVARLAYLGDVAVIPFYGPDRPELFEIERRTMDRPGKVIEALDSVLPRGRVLDIGAGNGFTAGRLASGRTVVPMEPAAGMVDASADLPWVRGDAEHLPFADGAFDAAYATWAYFFSAFGDVSAGVGEAKRVSNGPVAIVDNLGGDEFEALAGRPLSADVGWWEAAGFELVEIETAFVFDSVDEARTLLGFFFGDPGAAWHRPDIQFRVGLFLG